MEADPERRPMVLVIEDVEETRDGIERLLRASGYLVSSARDEAEALFKARLQPPDLILISVGADAPQSTEMGQRIRENARLNPRVPVVVFCVPGLPEGAEEVVSANTYLTRPDNFDQLRSLLKRLVGGASPE